MLCIILKYTILGTIGRIGITHRRSNKREEERIHSANETNLACHSPPDLADPYFGKVGNTLEEENLT